VGTWASLARVRQRDGRGNAASGAVVLVDADDNIVHAEGAEVVLYGVHDLVVVTRGGLTLVTDRDHAADLKSLIASLPERLRDRP
jgi:mannose-1-phosphate guanylyltransferase